MIKIKDLSEEFDENEKNTQPLKVLKLNILKEMFNLQNDLYQEQVKKYQETFQKLDDIAENQPFKIADESSYRLSQNSFDEDDSDAERFDILRAKIDELENKILTFEKKNKEIAIQIESFENNIDVLREEKTETNWKITSLNIITFWFF